MNIIWSIIWSTIIRLLRVKPNPNKVIYLLRYPKSSNLKSWDAKNTSEEIKKVTLSCNAFNLLLWT